MISSLSYLNDSLVIGQEWNNDQRIILFVGLKNGIQLSDKIKRDIKLKIQSECSRRHVPEKIIKVLGIPYTMNGKKVELAAKQIIEKRTVLNVDALKNPEVLEYYKNIPELEN